MTELWNYTFHRSSPERNVRVGMDFLKVLGQECVRVELVALWTPDLFVALHFHDAKDNVCASRYSVLVCKV